MTHTHTPDWFPEEVVQMWSVSPQRIVRDHEVIVHKRELQQPVNHRVGLSVSITVNERAKTSIEGRRLKPSVCRRFLIGGFSFRNRTVT